ncbi:hypothetical protein SAMN05421753_112195 [Planctomicrobium piriforme]|uniref:Uncharacterized protein n=1 Tax=Planctomicrobium piriforme TaxID=1576369 RepID=A0A1I3LAB5_9PLAN|nr:hypothetical protein SAMN05421753_112195 [Planctomicrobium piriforme]
MFGIAPVDLLVMLFMSLTFLIPGVIVIAISYGMYFLACKISRDEQKNSPPRE